MLTGSVAPSRVQKLVSDCGVDFEMTPQSEARLRKAGATDEVVAAVQQRSLKPKSGPVAVLKLGGVTMEFVRIRPGGFQMGCSPGDSDCNGDEKPAHQVRITRGFEMGKHEVTQAQWEAVMGANPSNFKGVNRPVESMTWDDVQVFLSRLDEKLDGYRYRLPTEAEWEYTARAGRSENHAEPMDDVAWHDGNSGGQTHPVGQRKPNGWGLYDMQGNVWEWCADWYDPYYYAKSPVEDPSGPSSGRGHVLRGGSWYSAARDLRVSGRDWLTLGTPYDHVGFRCVREIQ